MIRRVLRMGRSGQANAIWQKTQKEVETGSMSAPLSEEELRKRRGNYFNVVPSFGLEQGVDANGEPKFRCIDDHTAGWCNLAARRLRKIRMSSVDYIAVMVRSGQNLAYRQVPLSPSAVMAAIAAVYDPSQDRVTLHEIYGQPFGAGHAVPNFYRVAEWFAVVASRLFHIAVDHFFDDFWIAEPSSTVKSALRCFRELAALLGFEFDPAKVQQPGSVLEVLGVVFDLSAVAADGSFAVRPKAGRVHALQ